MKKRYLSVALILCVAGSLTLSSCIGSFGLTHNVLKWNKQVGSKFVNELVFFAFWILPVYEVTSLADLLVINSIEFWSGSNPMTASTTVIPTEQGNYLVACDGKGYTITCEATGSKMRLDFDADTQTWSFNKDGEQYPLMTFVDDNHVKMLMPDGGFRLVDLTEEGVLAYSQIATQASPALARL
ncbi:MAG: DUF3332 domain-containing protein [Clostridium sp.]|nr:DUF3332 domain-containing protein [Prevotella sp.]MCM1429704.1 DUF3332 domain-containing protein [Clostridium sp.]MCM1474630.1 DUF3332 domain-containing protein [Muribaculaceae bacterium]